MFSPLLLAVLLVSETFGIIITQNTVSDGPVDPSEFANSVEVKSGAYWSIWDNQQNIMSSLSVETDACFYTSSSNTDPEVFEATNITNYGTVSVMAKDTNYKLTGHLENQGYVIFGSLDKVNAKFDTWNNNGTYQMVSPKGSRASVLPSFTINIPSGELVNTGNVCLVNSVYSEGSSMFTGSGCVQVYNGYFNLSDSSHTMENTIYLGVYGSLIYTPRKKTYTVGGFGVTSMIGSMYKIDSFSYSAKTETLTIKSGKHNDSFIIGPNYETEYFSIVEGQFNNGVTKSAVTYSKMSPNYKPPVCGEDCGMFPPAPSALSSSDIKIIDGLIGPCDWYYYSDGQADI